MSHQITLIPGDGIRPLTTPVGKNFGSITIAAKHIEKAVVRVIEKGETVAKDINPNHYVGTAEFADAVIEVLS